MIKIHAMLLISSYHQNNFVGAVNASGNVKKRGKGARYVIRWIYDAISHLGRKKRKRKSRSRRKKKKKRKSMKLWCPLSQIYDQPDYWFDPYPIVFFGKYDVSAIFIYIFPIQDGEMLCIGSDGMSVSCFHQTAPPLLSFLIFCFLLPRNSSWLNPPFPLPCLLSFPTFNRVFQVQHQNI